MKRSLETTAEPPNKKPSNTPLSLPKYYGKPKLQKHSRLFTHANVHGILMSSTQNRESGAIQQIVQLLTEAKELLKDEIPGFDELQSISTSASFDSGHHQQKYFEHMKAEEKDTVGKEEASEEVEEMSESKHGGSSFQIYDSGCKGLIFVGIRHKIDIVHFVRRFMELVAESKLAWPKECFIERILPIQKTCEATLPKITEMFKPLVQQHLSEEEKTPITWGIVAHHRNNAEVTRKSLIDGVATLVPAKHPVDLSKPNLTIILEVIKSTCCVCFTPDFNQLAKYNPGIFAEQLRRQKQSHSSEAAPLPLSSSSGDSAPS